MRAASAGDYLHWWFQGSSLPSCMRGGIFTQPSNIGSSTQDSLAVVPAVTARLSYRVTGAFSFRAVTVSCT